MTTEESKKKTRAPHSGRIPEGKAGATKLSVGRVKKKTTVDIAKTQEDKEEARSRIRIKIKAYDNKVIDQSTRLIMDTAQRSGAEVRGPIPLPTEKTKYTVLKSSFVHKDSRDQFEMRVHKRLIDIYDPTSKTVEDLQSLNLPAGVNIEIKM